MLNSQCLLKFSESGNSLIAACFISSAWSERSADQGHEAAKFYGTGKDPETFPLHSNQSGA